MKIIVSILVLLIFSYSTYSQETEESKRASEEYQDFVEDLFDDEEETDDTDMLDDFNPSDLKRILSSDSLGSLGRIVTGAITTYNLGEKGCSKTFICMWKTLEKYRDIINYERKLSYDKLDCKERQIVIEDYILFITSMNLDNYCLEHLHPDSNQLENHEIVDAMLAMGMGKVIILSNIDDFTGIDKSFFVTRLLTESYKDIWPEADPYCTEDLLNGNEWNDGEVQISELGCSCGEYIGQMDPTEKAKVLKDIRTIIDGINPIWQGQKLIELNQMLQALPCNN